MPIIREELGDEELERKWTRILLSWINRCIKPGKEVTILNYKILLAITDLYKGEIEDYESFSESLSPKDLERRIEHLYPKLILINLRSRRLSKKLYILTSMILYHCCMHSKTGLVDADICHLMSKDDQYTILRFCETLCAMEITYRNVELAIRVACESKYKPKSRANSPNRNSQKLTEDQLGSAKSSPLVKPVSPGRSRYSRYRSCLSVLPPETTKPPPEYSSNFTNYELTHDFGPMKQFYNLRRFRYSEVQDHVVQVNSANLNAEWVKKKGNVKLKSCLISPNRMRKNSSEVTGDFSYATKPSTTTYCLPRCICARCKASKPAFGGGVSSESCRVIKIEKPIRRECAWLCSWKLYLALVLFLLIGVASTALVLIFTPSTPTKKEVVYYDYTDSGRTSDMFNYMQEQKEIHRR